MFSIYRKRYALAFSIALVFLAISVFFTSELIKQEYVYKSTKEKLNYYIDYFKDVLWPKHFSNFEENILFQELSYPPFDDKNIISIKIYTKSKKEFILDKVKIENEDPIKKSLIRTIFSYLSKDAVKSQMIREIESYNSSQEKYEKISVLKESRVLNFKDSPGGNEVEIVIYYDITENINRINKIFFIIFTLSAVLILILSVFFIIISIKADRLAEKIHEHAVSKEKRKQRDTELENQKKDELLTNITHELKTPLNAIIGFSEIIMNEKAGPLDQEYKNFAAHIYSSGKNLLDMINNILDFSKVRQGKIQIIMEDVDAVKLLSNCLKSFEEKASNLGIIIKCNLLQTPVLIKADPKRLKQVLVNLLSNSLKFTKKAGIITGECEISDDKKELIIKIKDTGIGMEETDIKRALSPFEQINRQSSQKREGAGLGLPLAKMLVEKMNGKLEIKSVPNSETIVSLHFPLSP